MTVHGGTLQLVTRKQAYKPAAVVSPLPPQELSLGHGNGIVCPKDRKGAIH